MKIGEEQSIAEGGCTAGGNVGPSPYFGVEKWKEESRAGGRGALRRRSGAGRAGRRKHGS